MIPAVASKYFGQPFKFRTSVLRGAKTPKT